MSGKREHFNELFYHWRLDKAKKEEDILLTAIDISGYAELDLDLRKINEDFKDSNSLKFKELERRGKRGLGTLLYCKFMVEDYLQSLEPENKDEKILLEAIMLNLEGLYLQGQVETQTKLNSLIANCNLWLDNHTSNRSNNEHIKSLCYALFMLLKILDISLKGLDSWSKSLAKPFIKLELLEKDTENLLKKTEEKLTLIEAQIVPKDEHSPPKNLAEYLNQNYLQRIEKEPRYNHDALLEKVSLLEIAVQNVEKLSQILKKRETIKFNSQLIQSLLFSLEENERRVLGRKYFLELIAENNNSFTELMGNIGEEAKMSLVKKITQLRNPDNYQKVSSSMQYAASWITAIPASALRLTVPQTWQETVVSIVPATLDSECKCELRILVEKYLKDLNQDLKITEERVKECMEHNLASQEQYEKFINDATPKTIEIINEASKAMLDGLIEYRNLLKLAFIMQQKLKEIKNLDTRVQEFLHQYDGFLVKISNFFAKFFSFFKTETAKLVDEVYETQLGLQSLKEEYQKNFKIACEQFKKNSPMPLNLEDHLIAQTKEVMKQAGSDEKISAKKQNIYHSIKVIRQGFFSLKQEPCPTIEEPDELLSRIPQTDCYQ
ncbi:hypothetical protein [Legionella brunensis]|uniref:Purine NTPase n=1 Tax=Legionella brunensis TaxID=29422 RepID=A0A0W0SPF3_9GAMM|nr:hypothetical protein [Legionella brunensis]KTC85182.1 purine NTPase [Legionella brunensis]